MSAQRDSGPGSSPTLPIGPGSEPMEPGVLIANRYRAVRWIGRGGMGSVYEVEDCALGSQVALKMADGSQWDAAAVAQLKRELQLARRVTHPNVCRVHDFGVHSLADGTTAPFLTMELIDGETLSVALAANERFGVTEALRIAEPIAAALDAAHAVGVVHRDLKCGNVMIAGGRVIVMDFGLAIDVAKDGIAGDALVGSPAYMAPEQVEGRPVTVATDVYSFGIVLFELVTGRLPFVGDNITAVAVQRLLAPPPSPRSFVPDLPQRWEATILRCLRLPPHERFETCGDIVRALRDPDRNHERAAEQRSIALVVARDVRDRAGFQAAMAQHGGTTITLSGDRIAGVFGAEHSRGDEIERALAAAHASSEAADRIGLAVGHASLRDGSLTGEALEEAEAVIERGGAGVLAAPHTASMLASLCEVSEMEPGLFALGPRRHVATASLVGRDAELSTLRRARDAVLAESRLLATWIVGPPGSGKSRLAEAAIGLALESDMRVASARASTHDARSYALFALPSDAATEENRAARELADEDEDVAVARMSSAFGRGSDAQALTDRLRGRVLARLSELAGSGPAVLVLDDLQWADPSSLALLEELPSVLPEGTAIWLVLVAREELGDAKPELLSAFESAGRVDPSPLRAADVSMLVHARTGSRPKPSVAQAIADRAGGNPLFVEQILDGLDPRALGGDSIEEWPLPATIEHAVQARLDQLPGEERECLKLLSVLGRAAAPEELEALGARGAKVVLASLVRRGLVARTEGAFRLRSLVVGDVTYRLIDAARRRDLHRLAAELVAAGGRDTEEVARHLEDAGDARAAGAYVRAALANAVRGDSRGVLRCAARAMERGIPDEQAFAVHFARAEAARFVGDAALQKKLLEETGRTAQSDRERALVASEEGEWFRRNRRPTEALAHLERAVDLARASEDLETQARAVARRSSTLVTLGRTEEARAALKSLGAVDGLAPATRAIVEDVRAYCAASLGDHGAARTSYASAAKLYAEAGDRRRAAGAESNHADADNRLGRFEEAQRALRRALELARRVGNRLTEGYALMNLGYALAASGRNDDALTTLEGAIEIARVIGDSHLELGARLYAARARLARVADDSLARDLEALAGEASFDPTLEANAHALAARAWLAHGDPQRACGSATAALAIRDARGAIEEGEGELFWAAALAFHAAGRAELAADARDRGRARVHELAARIADPEARQSFLERIPAHRFLA